MKKRKGLDLLSEGQNDNNTTEDQEEGRKRVASLVRQENDAIRSFFQPLSPARKKKKLSKSKSKKAISRGKKETQTLEQLAVPASEPTPFVKQLEETGAGYVIDSKTGTAKKVTRGKHASKGRGIVGSDVVLSAPLPKNVFSQFGGGDADDDDDNFTDDKFMVAAKDQDDADENDPSLVLEYVSLPDDTFIENDDGLMVAKPIYSNSRWAESAIRKLKKPNQPPRTSSKKATPIFYIRRETAPEEFLVDEHEIVKDGQQVKIAGDDQAREACVTQVVESWAKLLTFHSDGTFVWPESSKHLCWNCCHTFSGPPAMIPRHFNRSYGYYQVYGNFCTWACAKRYATDNTQDSYSSATAPSLDHFAWKYFGACMPVPTAPPRILLNSFSEFGLSIEEYRKIGQVNFRDPAAVNYQIVQPPCVPYEVLVVWQKQNPKKVKLKTGYEKQKKHLFEQRMVGAKPMPDMPEGISEDTKTISDIMPGKLVPSKKQKKKNLLNLLE